MSPLDLWTVVRILERRAVDADATLASLPAPRREAHLFRHVLAHLPIGFEPGEGLAGEFGWQYLNPEQQEAFRREVVTPPPAATDITPLRQFSERFHCTAGYTLAHTCADYERVISRGLGDVLAEIQRALPVAAGPARDTLDAMGTAVDAVLMFAERYARAARRRAATVADSATRADLERIADACDRVPRAPATSLHDAVQAVWLVHAAIGLSERCASSLSLGRLDQFLYPLYCRDLARGVPRDDIKRTVRDLWRKLNRFGDPACAVNLGGLDAQGRDLFNPLSALLVEVSAELALPAPLLAARVHDRLPDAVFDSLLDPRLLAAGQPTFYGETPCREAMRRRGVAPGDVPRFAVNSCMGLVIPGEEISDMWGAVVNLLLPLELALNAGQPFARELPVRLRTSPQTAYAGIDALLAKFAEYATELIDVLVAENRQAAAHVGAAKPNPFLSALTRDCVARAADRAAGGARYHAVIVEGFGWCNAADALTAIRRLVFEDKRYGLAEMVAAARQDYLEAADLHAAVLGCPKYGNGNAEADTMAQRVTAMFAAAVSRHSQAPRYYLPSYHTLNAHIGAGRKLPASLDGRRAGEPLGKNVGPMPGRNRQGLTGVLLSASAVDQPALSGGQALDISLDPALLASPEARRKLQALLLTYFRRGGLQIQVNGVTAAQLRRAVAEPDKHRDLIVRIAGYSARFTALSSEVQAEMIRRFEHGL